MDAAAKRLDAGEVKDAGVAASLHSSLGSAYAAQGDLAAAEKHLRAALALRKKALGDNAPQVASDQENLDKLLHQRAK